MPTFSPNRHPSVFLNHVKVKAPHRSIPWFILAMVGAFLTMSTIQISWLRSSIRMKQQLFDDSVQHALNEVADLITRPSTEILTMELEAMSNPASSHPQAGPPIGQGIGMLERRMLIRIDAFRVDSLISSTLSYRGIDAEAWVAVFDRYGQPVRLDEAHEAQREAFLEDGYSVGIDPLRLVVYFPKLNKFLQRNLLGQFALTGLMLAVIAGGLFSAVVTANRNKRIDRIRRDLMNNLTHELKTPISTIGLASEALSDPDMRADEGMAKHYLGLIREENKRLSVLVENVLQASLADQGTMRVFLQPLNIHDILREVVRNNAIAIRKQHGKVQWSLEATDPVCEVDRIHFTNIVYNLIDNALKYSKGEPLLTISSRQVTNGVELRFQDNGIGIPKEHLGKVFDRLYRVPTGNVHDVKGFGLGLSYVQTVVERHGGAIRVESEIGKGSTFVIELPKTQQTV